MDEMSGDEEREVVTVGRLLPWGFCFQEGGPRFLSVLQGQTETGSQEEQALPSGSTMFPDCLHVMIYVHTLSVSQRHRAMSRPI